MQRKLTPSTSLDNLRREAKRWLKALRAQDAVARGRFERAYPTAEGEPVLRDVQHALACEYGMSGWTELKKALDYHRAAKDWVDAFEGDAAALDRLNQHYKRKFNYDDLKAEIWRRDYAFRQRAFRLPKNYFPVEEAQIITAQDAGFGSWEKLIEAVKSGLKPQGAPYVIDSKENSVR